MPKTARGGGVSQRPCWLAWDEAGGLQLVGRNMPYLAPMGPAGSSIGRDGWGIACWAQSCSRSWDCGCLARCAWVGVGLLSDVLLPVCCFTAGPG